MKEYHSSLLDTVYWALGTVATVTTLLVGFGWFANFKFHEAEKQRLKEDLEIRLKEATATLDARLSVNQAEMSKLIDSRLDAFLTRVARDIDLAREEASRATENNRDELKQLKVSVEALRESERQNAKRDSELEATLRVVEEHVWDLKGIPTNTLLTQAQGLKSAMDADSRHHITSVLDRMRSTITDSILPKKMSLPKSAIEWINLVLAKAETTEPILATELRELVKQIVVRSEEQK